MYISIPELSKKIGVSSSTINNYMKENKNIKALFVTHKFKSGYNNTTYRKLMFDKDKLSVLKVMINEIEENRQLAKEKKKLMNRSVKDCLANGTDCVGCTSSNRIACDYFLQRQLMPPIKRIAYEAIDRYGVTIG